MSPKPYYSHGEIDLYHGDCLHVMPHLEASSVDLVIADPIYGVSMPGVSHVGKKGDTRNLDFFDGDSHREACDLAIAATRECERLLQPHGSLYVWCGHRQFSELTVDLEARGWTTRFLVWSKACPCPPPPGAGWPSAAELCVYAFKSGRRWEHNGKNAPRSNVFVADSYRHGQPGKVDHPTQKPFDVICPPMLASSKEGDLVLDFCAGSGTTLVAAKANGRRAIGIELEERYCEIAANRLRQEVLF